MPADDLVLNVKQIAGYPLSTATLNGDLVLVQRGGLGGPYTSIVSEALVATALLTSYAPLQVGLQAPADADGAQAFLWGISSPLDGAWLWNGYVGSGSPGAKYVGAGPAALMRVDTTLGWQFFYAIPGTPGTLCDFGQPFVISPSGYLSGCDQILLRRDPSNGLEAATAQWVTNHTVTSFNGRLGAVQLWIDDIICAGGAPIYSPRFSGEPRAPTPPPTSNSSRLATTGFVQGMLAQLTLDFAPLDSPAFTGTPTGPTAPLGSADGTLATTAFVQTAIAGSVAGVASFNTRTGIVTLTNADITAAGGAVLNSPAFTGAPTAPTPPPSDSSTRIATTAFVLTESGFAPIASPTFTGVPAAPTPTPGTNTTQIATTAFVLAALAGISVGVATFNGRSGAVTLIANDITAAGGAILASPAFTGTPTAPNPPPGDSSTRLATTAYVQSLAGFAPLASPAFTGVPTAPTAAPGANTSQIATTAFVEAAIANSTAGVASFNGRTGAVTLQANDISAAGGALLASPAFTGTPSAPTAALGVSSTQLATTAYVINAAATATPLMDGTAAVGIGTTWARADHVHPTDTTRAAAAALANYLPLAGGTVTGGVTANTGMVSKGGNLTCWQNAPATQVVLNLCDNTGAGKAFFAYTPTTGSASMINSASTPNGTLLLDGVGNLQYIGSGNAMKAVAGGWVAISDARIKTVEGDYTDGLDQVLALRPVVFSFKGNAAEPGKASPHAALMGKSFVGFIAQELETVFPAMVSKVSGFIDGKAVDDLRQMDVSELTYALVNAVKALAARLETLEARMAT